MGSLAERSRNLESSLGSGEGLLAGEFFKALINKIVGNKDTLP